MDLADALAAAASPRGGRMLVDQILERLDDKNRATLQTALDADPLQVSASQIGRALRATGVEISDAAVSSWRRRHRER